MEELETQGAAAPETSAPENENLESSSESQEQLGSQLVDLDSLEKFRYGGREWTPKDLQSSILLQNDYTKKTQALADERRYYDNLAHDLANVKADPRLIAQFKQTYPEKFHSYLKYVTPAQAQAAAQQQQQRQQQQAEPKSEQALEERLNRIESDLHEKKVAAIEAELDAKLSKLSEKYPMADEEAALARAQAFLDKKRIDHGSGATVTDKDWDAIYKSVHERNQKLADQYYSKKVKEQTQANRKGKDVASGGGIPGQAPQRPKTIKEASQFALQELENS